MGTRFARLHSCQKRAHAASSNPDARGSIRHLDQQTLARQATQQSEAAAWRKPAARIQAGGKHEVILTILQWQDGLLHGSSYGKKIAAADDENTLSLP